LKLKQVVKLTNNEKIYLF
jgi:hypothetical protein